MKSTYLKTTLIAVKLNVMRTLMETMIQTNDQLKLRLLDKCFDLGLPACSQDDIHTLKMYLDVDSRLEVEDYNFQTINELKKSKPSGIISLIVKMLRL